MIENNVYQLPIKNKNTTSSPIDNALNIDMDEFKKNQICEMSDWILESIRMTMVQMGHIDQHRFEEKDMMMLFEAVASSLCRYHHIEHPMHSLVEDMIKDDEEESEDELVNDPDRL